MLRPSQADRSWTYAFASCTRAKHAKRTRAKSYHMQLRWTGKMEQNMSSSTRKLVASNNWLATANQALPRFWLTEYGSFWIVSASCNLSDPVLRRLSWDFESFSPGLKGSKPSAKKRLGNSSAPLTFFLLPTQWSNINAVPGGTGFLGKIMIYNICIYIYTQCSIYFLKSYLCTHLYIDLLLTHFY